MVKFSKILAFVLAVLSVGRLECGGAPKKWPVKIEQVYNFIQRNGKPFVGGLIDVALIHAAFSAIRGSLNIDKDMNEKSFLNKYSELAITPRNFFGNLCKERGGKNKTAKFLNLFEVFLILVYLSDFNGYRKIISPINLISKLE